MCQDAVPREKPRMRLSATFKRRSNSISKAYGKKAMKSLNRPRIPPISISQHRPAQPVWPRTRAHYVKPLLTTQKQFNECDSNTNRPTNRADFAESGNCVTANAVGL